MTLAVAITPVQVATTCIFQVSLMFEGKARRLTIEWSTGVGSFLGVKLFPSVIFFLTNSQVFSARASMTK